jgi:16S rRNA (guanine966-N2)-methyltransferase
MQNANFTAPLPPLPSRSVASSSGRVRIIGGAHRGRTIRFPNAEGLRPTPDRVRETLFNWLGQDLTGRRSLDLFAGSGALSFEAASRGAALAVAVDRNRTLVESIRANASAIGVGALEAHIAEASAWLARERRLFDVIFLDPPFREDPWRALLAACEARLAPAGFIYAEAGREIAPPHGFDKWRHATAGQVHYHLFRRSS